MGTLIISDGNQELFSAAELLRDEGEDVSVVTSINDAIHRTRTQSYELVVADLMVRGEPVLPSFMAAQYRNPQVSTVVLNNTRLFQRGELFEMLPSLRCVLGQALNAQDLREVALYFLHGAAGGDTATMDKICDACLLSDLCGRSKGDYAVQVASSARSCRLPMEHTGTAA